MYRKQYAFTLIELLIVVAVIAILAAIAVPNFLEAQTRAKVSRAMSDMRNLSTALESYSVDHDRYPAYGHPNDFVPTSGRPHLFTPLRLTTPVAYVGTVPEDLFHDPLSIPGSSITSPAYYYMHAFAGVYQGRQFSPGHIAHHYARVTGHSNTAIRWTLWSHGPDNRDDHGVIAYDPTNGTLSQGDIIRFGP